MAPQGSLPDNHLIKCPLNLVILFGEGVILLHQKYHTFLCSFQPGLVFLPSSPQLPLHCPCAAPTGGQHKGAEGTGCEGAEQLLTWQKDKWLEQLFHILGLLKRKDLKWPFKLRPWNMGQVTQIREIKAIHKYN